MNASLRLAILLSITLLSVSCTPDTRTLEDKLQVVLEENIEEYDVRGVSAAVIMPGRPLWTGVAGISHDTVSIAPDMLFAIGSITKNFVATLTLQLAEDGTLSLDDPLSLWLPAYPHIDSTITIRQLLNHTSGLYMFWDNQKIWDDLKADRAKIWTPEEVLSYIKEPCFRPGGGWRYSNTNYLLLAMIIEKATGSTLATEFRERFWRPLNLESPRLSIEEEIPNNQAHIHGDNFNNDGSDNDLTFLPRASHESITFGSAGLFMDAADLARWCDALYGGEVLQQQSMDEMLQFFEIGFGRRKRGYGLGVQLFEKRVASGERAIGHSGANIGTMADMVYLPDHDVTVVVMINAFSGKCVRSVTTGLSKTILKDLDVIGIIPYFDFIPYGILMIAGGLVVCVVVLVCLITIRRRRKMRSTGSA